MLDDPVLGGVLEGIREGQATNWTRTFDDIQ